MESINVRTADRKLRGKLKWIAVYVNGVQWYRITAYKGLNKDANHDFAAAETAKAMGWSQWAIELTHKTRSDREWLLHKVQ